MNRVIGLLWFVLLVVPGAAQAATWGQMRVIALDLDEIPVVGVFLQLDGDAFPAGSHMQTDANGEALFTELPPGLYHVTATKTGVYSVTVTEIWVNANRTAQQLIRLRPGHGMLMVPDTGEGVRAQINDRLDFHTWLERSEEWAKAHASSHRPLDLSERRFIEVRDAKGRPVLGERVVVVDQSRDATVSIATTPVSGRVPFWPNLAPIPTVPYVVLVEGRATPWSGREDLVIQTAADRPPSRFLPVDVVLVLDTTTTMANEIATLQAALPGVLERLETLGEGLGRPIDLRLGLVRFRDQGERYVTLVTPLTRELGRVAQVVEETGVAGGGDAPEALEEALVSALSMDWRPEAAKLALVLSDAPPHLDRDSAPYPDSARGALAIGLKVHTLATNGMPPSGAYIFRQLAELTGGSYRCLTRLYQATLDTLLFDLVRAEIEAE